MGLHVFFGCYHNLFRLMAKCGVLDNLLVKEHTHTFVNEGGSLLWQRLEPAASTRTSGSRPKALHWMRVSRPVAP